jgi:hypothetical protein
MVVTLILLAGCSAASGEGGPDAGPVDYPTGAGDLVFSIATEGGFVPVEFNLTRLPELALYGDGRLFTQGPQIMIYPGPALPNILVRQVSPEGVRAIVEEAAAAGLTGEDREFRQAANFVTDLPDTVFTLVTGGSAHRTSVYGFGSGEDLKRIPRSDAGAMRDLHRLRDRLTDLETWLPDGSIGPEEPYVPTEMRIFVGDAPAAEEGLEQPPVAWPLAQPLAGFGTPVAPGNYRCGTVSGDDLTRVLEAARSANQLTPWESEGRRFGLSFRPLLPDEAGCPEQVFPEAPPAG